MQKLPSQRKVTAALPTGSSSSRDELRWFEESLNALVIAADSLGDPWRLQEIVQAAEAHREQPDPMKSLWVDTVAGEAERHVSPDLRARLRAGLEAFARAMQGEAEAAPPESTAPRSRETSRPRDASLVHRIDVVSSKIQESNQQARRRLRLAREAISAQTGVLEERVQEHAALKVRALQLEARVARYATCLAESRETLEIVREALSEAATEQGVELLDELATEIHLARIATSAEVARQGASSAVASVAALLRRLDARVRRACSDDALKADPNRAGLRDHARNQLEALAAAFQALGDSQEEARSEATRPTPERDEATLPAGLERVDALLGDALACCESVETQIRKIPTAPKSRRGASKVASKVAPHSTV